MVQDRIQQLDCGDAAGVRIDETRHVPRHGSGHQKHRLRPDERPRAGKLRGVQAGRIVPGQTRLGPGRVRHVVGGDRRRPIGGRRGRADGQGQFRLIHGGHMGQIKLDVGALVLRTRRIVRAAVNGQCRHGAEVERGRSPARDGGIGKRRDGRQGMRWDGEREQTGDQTEDGCGGAGLLGVLRHIEIPPLSRKGGTPVARRHGLTNCHGDGIAVIVHCRRESLGAFL